jgi:hypothetical protein
MTTLRLASNAQLESATGAGAVAVAAGTAIAELETARSNACEHKPAMGPGADGPGCVPPVTGPPPLPPLHETLATVIRSARNRKVLEIAG